MELLTFVSFILAADAALISRSVPQKRQLPSSGGNASAIGESFAKVAAKTPLNPFDSKTLQAERFPEAYRQQVIWGPYKLQGAHEEHLTGEGGIKLDQHSDLFEYSLGGLCKDCMVLDARFDVTDNTGRKLQPSDSIYTHHIVISTKTGRSAVQPAITQTDFCDGAQGFAESTSKSGGQANGPFGGTEGISSVVIKGQEANHVNFADLNNTTPQSGWWIGKDDKIMHSVEVVNYKDVGQDIYFTIDMEYLSVDAKPTDMMDIGFVQMAAMDCNDITMSPPKDRPKTYSTSEFDTKADAYVMNLMPHLHDGALNMRLFVNDNLACEQVAVYGQDTDGMDVNGQKWETIHHYTPCDTVKIKTGDKVKMTSDYDLTKHSLRPDSADHDMGTDSMAIAFIQLALVN